MNRPGLPDPGPIVRLTTAFWDSQALLTASRLRLFDQLASGPKTAEQVAGAIGLDARRTELLMRVLAALGLLEARDDRFANSAAAAAFLVSTSPAYMGNAMRYSDQLYATWGRLEDSLRSGKPALPAESYLGDDVERTRTFVYAMHGRAMGVARVLVEVLDLRGRKAMLDVGGGPGTYSILLTERHPGLRSEVLELPGVAAVAREIVAAAGAGDRVSVRDGDYHSSDFGSGYDVVLMSGMFHRESEASCRRLIDKARACLGPGGLLVVSDVFADAGGCSPPFAALFGLNMALTAPDGTVHADADVAAWMRETGFDDIGVRPLPPPMPHRVVTGTLA
jgi:predicted O-methyltransferase YrrM